MKAQFSSLTESSTETRFVQRFLNACELNVERLDRLERKGNEIIAFIGGQPMLRIVPVPIEPFDVAIRDRVRTAFKGICSTDFAGILSRASRLPGFDAATANQKLSMRAGAATGSMLLGFPGNWAFAMRNALEQVGIEVKQSHQIYGKHGSHPVANFPGQRSRLA